MRPAFLWGDAPGIAARTRDWIICDHHLLLFIKLKTHPRPRDTGPGAGGCDQWWESDDQSEASIEAVGQSEASRAGISFYVGSRNSPLWRIRQLEPRGENDWTIPHNHENVFNICKYAEHLDFRKNTRNTCKIYLIRRRGVGISITQ